MKTSRLITAVFFSTIISILVSCGGSGHDKATKDSEDETSAVVVNNEVEAPVENDSPDLFVSEQGGFKVDFYGVVEIKPQTVPVADGQEKLIYNYEKTDEELYTIACSELSQIVVDATSAEELMLAAKEEYVNAWGIVIEDEAPLGSDNQNIIVRAAGEVQGANIYSCYSNRMKDNRLYELSVIKVGSYPDNEELSRFFSSFETIEE